MKRSARHTTGSCKWRRCETHPSTCNQGPTRYPATASKCFRKKQSSSTRKQATSDKGVAYSLFYSTQSSVPVWLLLRAYWLPRRTSDLLNLQNLGSSLGRIVLVNYEDRCGGRRDGGQCGRYWRRRSRDYVSHH